MFDTLKKTLSLLPMRLGSYSLRIRQYLASGGHREGEGGCLLQWSDSAVLHWLQYKHSTEQWDISKNGLLYLI